MKTLFRILTVLALFLFLATPASEAVSIKPKAKVGAVLHAIGRSKRAFSNGTVAEFYKGLSPAGRSGLALIVSAAAHDKGNAPSASHVIRAISRIAGTLKLSAHNMTLPEFLEELPKLKARFKNDPKSLEALDRMLVGLTTNVKQSGVHELPIFTHALGTSAELADCALLLQAVRKLAPKVDGRKWVEAVCEDTIAVKGKIVGMPGKWMLEVKCWRKFKGERAIERLKTQAGSTYTRLVDPPLSIHASGLIEGPGYVVRFAAAGKNGENLAGFKVAVRDGVREGLLEQARKQLGIKSIPAEVLKGIDEFVSSKVIVEMVQ